MTKICKSCGEEKDLSCYYKSSKSPLGVHPHCKPCYTELTELRKKHRHHCSVCDKKRTFKYDSNGEYRCGKCIDKEEVTEKMCSACGKVKKLDDYYKSKTKRLGVESTCIDCHKVRSKSSRYVRMYGITDSVYREMLKSKEFTCWNPSCDTRHSEDSPLYIDHDHDTGAVRGLLCNHCNFAEGHVGGSPMKLLGLIEYLGFDLEEQLQHYFERMKIFRDEE